MGELLCNRANPPMRQGNMTALSGGVEETASGGKCPRHTAVPRPLPTQSHHLVPVTVLPHHHLTWSLEIVPKRSSRWRVFFMFQTRVVGALLSPPVLLPKID